MPPGADKNRVNAFHGGEDDIDSAVRVLLVEDSPHDAELVVRELRRGGLAPVWERVETEEGMNRALDRQPWDAILSDHSMPCFSAPAALALLKLRDLDVPFIIVSGAIGEDAAVAAMKAGAHDYVTKKHLPRLVPALKREVREVRVRLEKKLAQKALRETEERYKTLVELSPDAVCVCQNNSIVYLNYAAARLLGAASATAILGRPLLDFAPPGGLDHTPPPQPDAGPRCTAPLLIEDKLVRLDSSVVDVEVAVAPVCWLGQPAVQLVIRDVCERKKLAQERERHVLEIEEARHRIEDQADMLARLSEDLALAHHEAEDAAKAKRRLLSGTGHEIGAGLNKILGMARLLLDSELVSPNQRDLAAGVRITGQGLLDTLNEILNYFAMEAGELNLEMIDFDLNMLLEKAIALPSSQAAERRLALMPGIAGNVPNHLRGDALRLGQILANLAGIAVRSSRGGEIAVRISLAAQYDDAVDLRIEVGGTGVAPETWKGVFQPFFQADSPDGDRPARDVLALAISRRLVERMGGSIDVANHPGSGSTVWLTLPLEKSLTRVSTDNTRRLVVCRDTF